MSKARNYVLTINNPENTLAEQLEMFRRAGAERAIAQLEKGEQGTPHFQCFIGFKESQRFRALKKKFPTAHIEIAKSAFDSWQYCQKEDTRLEGPQFFGEMPKPRKADGRDFKAYNQEVLQNLEGMVEDGRVNIKDYVKLKQAQQMFKLHTAQHAPLSELVHEWHYGATGTGKSRHCRETYPDAYIKMPNKWWDGYQEEAVVLIEDV